MKKSRKICYNCKYSGEPFKVNSLTHMHCENESLYSEKDFNDGKWCAWDSLREFWDTCELFEYVIDSLESLKIN